MATLGRFRAEQPADYERLRALASGERPEVPATAEDWLAADMATLGRLRESSPADYERLRDEAVRLNATRTR